MLVTIHQPEHMPWAGFFHKMAMADVYVLLDIVQFTKNNWQNRNRAMDRNGKWFWLSVPVLIKGHTDTTIRNIKIDNKQPWRRKYWGRLRNAYCKHPFFYVYEEELETILFSEHERLLDLNIDLIEFFRKHLGIKNKLILASALDVSGKRSELLSRICDATKASSYLSGPSGRDYLDLIFFKNRNIKVIYHEYHQIAYPAKYFEPGLSIIDLLMNCGEQSAKNLGIA